MNAPLVHSPARRDDTVERIVGLLVRIPDAARRFTVPPPDALARFAVSADLCADFVAAGLPHAVQDGVALFDANDLESLALHLRLPAPRRVAMMCWQRTARRLHAAPTTYRVSVEAGCPSAHEGPCEYDVLLSDHRERVVGSSRHARLGEFTVELSVRSARLPPEVVELFDAFADVTYLRIARAASHDLTLITEQRIGECGLAARAMVREARRRGIPARQANGVIVAAPFSSTHNWAELRVEGLWLPVDPLLSRSMVEWGLADAGADPVAWPASLFHRLRESPEPLVLHGTAESPVTLPTRVER